MEQQEPNQVRRKARRRRGKKNRVNADGFELIQAAADFLSAWLRLTKKIRNVRKSKKGKKKNKRKNK